MQVYFIWFQEAEYEHYLFWGPVLVFGGIALGLTILIWLITALFFSKLFWKVIGIIVSIAIIIAIIGTIYDSQKRKSEQLNRIEKQNKELKKKLENLKNNNSSKPSYSKPSYSKPQKTTCSTWADEALVWNVMEGDNYPVLPMIPMVMDIVQIVIIRVILFAGNVVEKEHVGRVMVEDIINFCVTLPYA